MPWQHAVLLHLIEGLFPQGTDRSDFSYSWAASGADPGEGGD